MLNERVQGETQKPKEEKVTKLEDGGGKGKEASTKLVEKFTSGIGPPLKINGAVFEPGKGLGLYVI